MLKKLVTSGAMLAVMTIGVTSAQAQFRSDKAVYFTFSQPVMVPHATLPAGKYMFRLADSLANRHIVQVFDGNGMHLQAMFLSRPASRSDTPENGEVRFLESGAGEPPAISTYWYPGDRDGWEFVYPRSQAMMLVKTSNQPVLTTSRDVSDNDMSSSDIVRLSPKTEERAEESASAETVNEPAAAAAAQSSVSGASRAESAPAPSAQPSGPAVQEPRDVAPAPAPSPSTDESRTALPATASATPTILAIGLLSLAGLVWMRRRAHA